MPKITSVSCTVSSSRAFSANSGQSDAGSTTTASSSQPRTPPFSFCCSTSISMVSFSVVSEIAMVPDSECRTPTLIGQSAAIAAVLSAPKATVPASMVFTNFILTLLAKPGRALPFGADTPKSASQLLLRFVWRLASSTSIGRHTPPFSRPLNGPLMKAPYGWVNPSGCAISGGCICSNPRFIQM